MSRNENGKKQLNSPAKFGDIFDMSEKYWDKR